MPIMDKRRLYVTKQGTLRINPPKSWGEFYRIAKSIEVETVTDAPFIVFPPTLKTKEEKIDALQKIITQIQASPDEPYPEAMHQPPSRKGKYTKVDSKPSQGRKNDRPSKIKIVKAR